MSTMRTLLIITVALALGAPSSGCARGLGRFDANTFTVEVWVSAGMHPSSSRMTLSLTGGYHIKSDSGRNSLTPFHLTEAELKGLYQVLKKNRFSAISIHRKRVRDRGGMTITAYNRKNRVQVDNSGMEFVIKRHLHRFRNVSLAISTLVNSKTTGLRARVPIKTRGGNKVYRLSILVNGAVVDSGWGHAMGQAELLLAFGKHRITARIDNYLYSRDSKKPLHSRKEAHLDLHVKKDAPNKGVLVTVPSKSVVTIRAL
jgi:hypothetical protein